MKKNPTSIKTPPQRTCVACRTVGSKRGLIRLVRQPGGEVSVDETGRLPGRGAYLCRKAECWRKGAFQVERALKTTFAPAQREALVSAGRDLLGDDPGVE